MKDRKELMKNDIYIKESLKCVESMKKTKGLLTSFLYLMLSTHCSTALSYETHARILYTTKLSNIDYNRDYPEADRIFPWPNKAKATILFCFFSFVFLKSVTSKEAPGFPILVRRPTLHA